MLKTFTLLVQFIGLLILTAHPVEADAPAAGAVRFVQNKGQWDADILFRADLPSGFLFLKKQSLHYVFYDSEALDALHFGRSGASAATPSAAARQASVPAESLVRAHGIDVQLANSLSSARIEPKNKVSEHLSYFLGDDPNHWASAVPSFAEIIYHDIYPGIDLRLFAYYQTLKYEFLVRPGADPAAIRLRYDGATGVRQEGEQLLIETTLLPFREGKPYSFTEKDGKTTEVPTAWKLDNRTASFRLPNGYDASQPLTIDPTLIFSTYSGSTSDNWGHTATYDSTGNLYTAGTVFGSTFKATTGAFQTQLGGELDVAVLKFSPDGKQLQYATYLGGALGDTPHSLIVNRKNELLIYGVTSSANFPTTATAYSRRFAGGTPFVPAGNSAPSGNALQGIYFKTGSDLYIAKLSTDGRTLRSSTYVGGSGNDGISDATRYLSIRNYGDELRGEIIVDPLDNVYVATVSFSDDFPVTANAPQRQRRGTADAVLIELNPDLSQLLWSTYFGGSGYDVAYAVRQGASGAVYAVGTTRSPDLPGTTGAYKTALGGNEDGFLVKFAGNNLERATYLGTTADDAAYLLDLDPEENPHVLGLTRGKYPVSDGVYQNVNSGQFIHALDPTLTRTVFSTVIGSGRAGITDISPTAFLVNDCGNIYLSGWGGYVNTHTSNLTSSTTGLPVTADAYRKTTDGSNYWLVLLERGAKSMLYATFFGSANLTGRGDHVDGGTSRFDKSGVIYHAACACGGTRFPTTAQAWSATNNSSNCNNAAFKFDIDRLEAAFDAFQGNQKDLIQGCSPLTLNFVNTSVGGVTYQWNFGDNTTSTTATQVNHTFSKPGDYVVVLTAYNKLTCQQVDTAQKIIRVFPADFKVSRDTTVCPETPFQLLASGGRTYQWSPATGLSSTTVANPTVTPKQTTQYVVRMTNEYGCTAQKTVTVTTDDSFRPVAQINTGAECGKAMKLELVNRTQGADSLRWAMDNGDTLRMATPGTYQYAESGHYNVTVTAYKGSCRLSVVIPVDVENLSEIPNVVTANGDGKNDVFNVGFTGAQLEIYNRWGVQIYKNKNYQNDWGHNVPYATYYYLLTTPQGVRCKGWLQVLN